MHIVKKIVIGALIVIILAELAWIFRPHIEGFDAVIDTTVEFPATDKTEMTPQEDEIDTDWIASLTPADRRARRGHNCNVTSRQIGPDSTMILTTTKSCEDGMAHTRPGDRIYIPDNINTVMRGDTVRHELIHIYQRRNPEAWYAFYQRSWSYSLFKDPPEELPKDLVKGRRSNPDTAEKPWACWLRRWWTIPIYKDAYNPRLRDVIIIYWDSWKNHSSESPPQEWTAFFGSPGQPEHPNEISACMIVANETRSEAGRRLMTWWSTQGIYV
jgi:hypothetical protein